MSLSKERNLICIRDPIGGQDVFERDPIQDCAAIDDLMIDFASFAGPVLFSEERFS